MLNAHWILLIVMALIGFVLFAKDNWRLLVVGFALAAIALWGPYELNKPQLARYQSGRDQVAHVTVATPMSAIIKKFGPPDVEWHSFGWEYVYDLSDGSSIWLGSEDGETLLYVSYEAANGQGYKYNLSSR